MNNKEQNPSGATDSVAPLNAQAWRPISSAPGNGTRILVFVPCSPRHHQMIGSFSLSGNFLSWPGRWQYEPSHWMPLPDPPE